MPDNDDKEGLVDTHYWDQRRGKVYSRIGGWIGGGTVYCHGENLLTDRLGKYSYMQNLVFILTGRKIDEKLAAWMDAGFLGLSYPDPRIWCNQIAALAGTGKSSVVAATCAGVLATDSSMYGATPLRSGSEFIQAALKKKQTGMSAEEIVADEIRKSMGRVNIMGYARPVALSEERVVAMEQYAKVQGMERGEHLQLAFDIEAILLRDHGERMNFNGYMSAFVSDQGFTPEQALNVCAMVAATGVTACYVDNADRPAEAFMPLRCDDIDYQGVPPRAVPAVDEID